MAGFKARCKGKRFVDQRFLVVRNFLFAGVAFAVIFTMNLLGVATGPVAVGLHSSSHYAQIQWFPSPSQKPNESQNRSPSVASKARVLFFTSPECRLCPEEAAKLEAELKRLGWKYEIEGIFVGDPPQVGRYLAKLRTYPFNFELGLDMDGRISKQYGVKTFPTTIIEVGGKRIIATRASELSEKLR
jgi:hypothetical protein